MIRALRQKHLQVWSMLAVLLPLGIITAWLLIPAEVKDRLLQPAATAALPVLVIQLQRQGYQVSLRTNTDSTAWQLEWVNKKALETSSGFVYLTDSGAVDGKEGELIGRVGERGVYRWELKMGGGRASKGGGMGRPLHLLYYDIFHHQVIDRINL